MAFELRPILFPRRFLELIEDTAIGPLLFPDEPGETGPPSSLAVELLRPDDLLSLRVLGYNLRLEAADRDRPRLVRIDEGQPAYLAVHFPPQSIAEEAFFETNDLDPPPGQPTDPQGPQTPKPPGSVGARIGGPSRLVFRLPDAVRSIPYSVEGLLDWSELDLAVAPIAAIPPAPSPDQVARAPRVSRPSTIETAIELPYRLILSPGPEGAWLHALRPVTLRGRTELWHTRLGRPVSVPLPDGDGGGEPTRLVGELDRDHPAPLRAIWSPDFRQPPRPMPGHDLDAWPFLSALSPRDRHQIVALTAGFGGAYSLENRQPFVPTPIFASRLMLSALGGWLLSRGGWSRLPRAAVVPELSGNRPALPGFRSELEQLDLSEWVHVATQGRDHYARVVYEGFLFPFGHRASLVKVTERKFQAAPSGPARGAPVAYSRQFMFIVVAEPEKQYADAPYANQGREMPLERIRFLTLVTPKIDNPYANWPNNAGAVPGTTGAFWVRVSGQDFPFHLAARDLVGNDLDFRGACIFIPLSDRTRVAAVRTHYVGATRPDGSERRRCIVPNQKLAFAPPSSPGADDTTLTVSGLSFGAQVPASVRPGFLPTLDRADVTIPAVEQLLGTSGSTSIKLYEPYLAGGFDLQAGIFAEVAAVGGLGIEFSADKAGGIATPNLSVTGLSRVRGPIGGSLATAAAGTFNPADFFSGPLADSARLFGSVKLPDLIRPGSADLNAPKLRTRAEPSAEAPERFITEFSWSPKVDPPAPIPLLQTKPTTALTIDGRIERPVRISDDPGAGPADGSGSFSFDGRLTDFTINFLDVIQVGFRAFHFAAANGQKLRIDVELDDDRPIRFLGPLEFVDALANIIPKGVFGSNGPSLDVGPTEAKVGYSLGLPPLSIGVFSLNDISIGTGLTLPYLEGKPRLNFSFAQRHRPFTLVVTLLGGGGFVGVELDAERVIMVEGALEFGGEFAFDIGVASGGVHVMAGIYFKLKAGASELAGYLDLGGEVSVLGIVSIAVHFNLTLTYHIDSEKVVGRATLVVAIKVVLVSMSVSLSVERSFGRSSGDPTIGDVLTPAEWQEYAAAFA